MSRYNPGKPLTNEYLLRSFDNVKKRKHLFTITSKKNLIKHKNYRHNVSYYKNHAKGLPPVNAFFSLGAPSSWVPSHLYFSSIISTQSSLLISTNVSLSLATVFWKFSPTHLRTFFVGSFFVILHRYRHCSCQNVRLNIDNHSQQGILCPVFGKASALPMHEDL